MNARRNFLLAVAALSVLLVAAVASGLLAIERAAFALPLGVMVLGVAFGGRLRALDDTDVRGFRQGSASFLDDDLFSQSQTNPATGLSMMGVFDTGGNLYGSADQITRSL